jgi:hypothetical protein
MKRRIAWFVYMTAAMLCRNLWQGKCGDCDSPIGISESYHPIFWNDPEFKGDGDGVCDWCRNR